VGSGALYMWIRTAAQEIRLNVYNDVRFTCSKVLGRASSVRQLCQTLSSILWVESHPIRSSRSYLRKL